MYSYGTQDKQIIHSKQMHSKLELQGKSLEELQTIAEEYGLNTDKKDHATLMYAIIDHESESAAQKAAEKPRKRSRIKTVDLVYSANQQKAKKIDKQIVTPVDLSLFNDLSDKEKELLERNNDEEKTETTSASEETEDETIAEKPKKKRGRPKKSQATKEEEKKEEEENTKKEELTIDQESGNGEETVTSNKRKGRTKKNQVVDNESTDVEESKQDDNIKSPEIDQPEEAQSLEDKETKENEDNQQSDNNTHHASLLDFGKVHNGKIDISYENTEETNFSDNTITNMNDIIYGDDENFIIIEDLPNEDNKNSINSPGFFAKYQNEQREQRLPVSHIEAQSYEQPTADTNVEEEPEPYDFNNIVEVSGVLDLSSDFGFLRSSDYNYLSSPDDIYVNPSQVQHYALKTGDVIEGKIRPPHEGEKFFPLVSITKINGCEPSVVRDRVPFEYLTPLFPEEKFTLCSGNNDTPSSRIVDLFAPIGKGQRALIVAQPKTGKTLLMKDIANSIARNHPEAYLMMLLIDERPEEVTDMARTVNAEVIASTFDAPADNHVKIANIVLEKAKRMVECGHDVVIFLDSITRLARAYNTVSPASGKVLTGGVDANALQKPKRFFGAARNIEGGGSLTIIATALIDTGSKMDEVIFEEFKGTGNMELQLDRALSNKRIFPAVNLIASSTRRDDLLQDEITRRKMWIIRNHIADMTNIEAMDTILKHIERTESNEEFFATMNN